MTTTTPTQQQCSCARCKIMAFLRCKRNPGWEREPYMFLAPWRKLSKESGIPVGPLITADRILRRCKAEKLASEQQRLLIAEAIHEEYQSARDQGRDYQRRVAKRKSVPSTDQRAEQAPDA